MSNILHRIIQLSDFKKVSISKIESKIGASKGVLHKAIQNSTDISTKWIVLIAENFPEINPAWLLTGRGEMLQTRSQLEVKSEVYLKSESIINDEKIKLLEENAFLYQENREILKEKIAILEKSLQDCQLEKQKYIELQKITESNPNVPNL